MDLALTSTCQAHDCLCCQGLRLWLNMLASVRQRGLIWLEPPCSSFVFLCRCQSQREASNDYMGDQTRQFVQVGNAHMSVAALIFPESVCEGFLLKISCGIRLLIIVISSSSSSHHHLIIISSSSYHHHLLLLSLSLSSSFLFSSSLSLSLSSSFLFSPSLSLSCSSFSSIFSAVQWRWKSCPSNPLRESGC